MATPFLTVNCAIALEPLNAKVRIYLKDYRSLCKEYKILDIKYPYYYELDHDKFKKISHALDLLNVAIEHHR